MIEIRFTPGEHFSLLDIQDYVQREMRQRPWQPHEIRSYQRELYLQKNEVTLDQGQVGYRLQDAENAVVLQLKKNGYVYSKLQPYDSWEQFRRTARSLWVRYSRSAKPVEIQRLGLRYMNRIDTGLGLYDIEEYLTIHPRWNEDELGDRINACDLVLGFPLTSAKAQARVMVRPYDQSILLDIDVSRSEDLPIETPMIFSLFNELKREERRIFEGCITDRSRELFS